MRDYLSQSSIASMYTVTQDDDVQVLFKTDPRDSQLSMAETQLSECRYDNQKVITLTKKLFFRYFF